MKPPRPKIHLLDVNDPLLAYCHLIVRCGVTLKNAEPKFMFTEEFARAADTPLPGVCLTCIKLYPLKDDKRVYVYGLCEAQEEKDAVES